MKVNVIGIRPVDFTDKKSGDRIIGKTLFVTLPSDYVSGLEGKKIFVKGSIDLSYLKIGDNVNILFNEKGKVDSVTLVK